MVNIPNKTNENIFEGAVSANPNFLTEFLNPNGSLERKTSVVVIYFDKRTYDVYRESTGKSGWSSRETRTFENSKPIKDSNKYRFPPWLDNTRPIYQFKIKGINCSAYIEPTIDQIDKFSSIFERADEKNLVAAKEKLEIVLYAPVPAFAQEFPPSLKLWRTGRSSPASSVRIFSNRHRQVLHSGRSRVSPASKSRRELAN